MNWIVCLFSTWVFNIKTQNWIVCLFPTWVFNIKTQYLSILSLRPDRRTNTQETSICRQNPGSELDSFRCWGSNQGSLNPLSISSTTALLCFNKAG
jgi:hypothetical protein